MAYATVKDVEVGFRTLDADEKARAEALLSEAAIMIDATNTIAQPDVLRLVSCRMVRRAIGDADSMQALPIGATQGSISAGGYAQSWTIGGGSSGELYIAKAERKLLGLGNAIGSYSPVQEMTAHD